MHARVLAPFTVLVPLVTPVDAQCGTDLEYFDQSIGPLFEPSVSGFALWDPDGAGPANEVVAIAGGFFDLDGQNFTDLVAWDPETQSFSQLVPWTTGYTPLDIATSDDGRIAVTIYDPLEGFEVHEWSGNSWTVVGAVAGGGFDPSGVFALLYLPDGDLVAGGDFSEIEGVAASNVARWDGTDWAALGSGLSGSVRTLHLDPQGDLIAGTRSYLGGPASEGIARFDGAAWSLHLVGSAGVTDDVNDFAFLADGRVAATGVFDFPGLGTSSCVAVWDGSDWTLPGAGIAPAPNGSSTAFAVIELPGGDLLVGGSFRTAGAVDSRGLARWDGSAWSDAVGPTIGISTLTTELVDLQLGPGGDVWVGGQLFLSSIVGGLGRLTADCKAGATTYGTSGTGSAGPVELTPTSLPWLGTSPTAEVTGLAPGAIAFSLIGLQTDSTPLQLLLPNASADSTLLVLPDPNFFAPLPGSPTGATWTLPLPPLPVFAGLTLYLQALSVEPLPGGPAFEFAASNGLAWYLGLF